MEEKSEENLDSATSVVVTSSKSYVQHHDTGIIKDLNSLEKISEIDENEIPNAFLSRPPTTSRQPALHSQATFRSSSFKNHAASSDDSGEENDEEIKNNDHFLITELIDQNQDEYSSDEFDFNDLDISTPKKKQVPVVTYENDIYNEKDWDTDLEEEEEEVEETHNPKEIYKKMCDNLNVVPCRYFLAHLDKQKLIMRYHQFSNDEIRAISKPLWNNFQVEKLHLDGNWIEFDGAKYLSRMIRQNDFITELSLADNRLGEETEGTLEVCRMISENCILKKLNLSGNCFSDRDVEILTTALEKNRLLKELDLSHNQFGDEGGKFLGQYISSNDSLEVLDISWNNFRNKAAKEIAIGIKENVRLKRCNVSFNGFDADAGRILADVIKQNNTIEFFNISNTRLNADCAAAIANALEQNDSLKSLNMTNNPISSSGALAIIYAIKLNNASLLEILDLSEIPVTREFENVLKEIQESKPEFKCKRGPVISTSNTKSILYEGGSKVDFEKIISSMKSKF